MRKILIISGTGNLGKAIINYFNNKNYFIYFSSTSKIKINKMKNHKRVVGVVCNLLSEKSLEGFIKKAYLNNKYFDLVINCSGIFKYDNLESLNYKSLVDTFKVNTFSTILINKFVKKYKKDKKVTKIISIGSSSSYEGFKNTISYCGSKHALLGVVKSINRTYHQKKIINFSINPGSLDNKMGRSVRNINKKKLIKQKEVIKVIEMIQSLDSFGFTEDIFLKRFG